MAIEVVWDADVSINSVDLSDACRSVTVRENTQTQTFNVMGSEGVRKLPGLTDGMIDVEFYCDEAASDVIATLEPLKGPSGGTFTVVIKRSSGVVGATNPTYTATCSLGDGPWGPFTAGEIPSGTFTFPVDNQIARATS